MSFKRAMVERCVGFLSRFAARMDQVPTNPKTIFVLRNNDIGDLIVITPLFEALRRRFPTARIVAGIGDWNRPVLENNPWVDEILSLNAPWHNKQICRHPHNSLRGWLSTFHYLKRSPESAMLRNLRADIGIDVLGSPQGALLLMQAGVSHRLGVRGYAGGYSGMQQWLEFTDQVYVGRFALQFVELLGLPPVELPSTRPQIYLRSDEQEEATETWDTLSNREQTRILIGFSGGYAAKCWSLEECRHLLERLNSQQRYAVLLVGGSSDQKTGDQLANGLSQVTNLAGKLNLRQTFALTSQAQQVITNSSMLMHVAAAFDAPTITTLGAEFTTAEAHGRLWNQSLRNRLLASPRAEEVLALLEETSAQYQKAIAS